MEHKFEVGDRVVIDTHDDLIPRVRGKTGTIRKVHKTYQQDHRVYLRIELDDGTAPYPGEFYKFNPRFVRKLEAKWRV